MNIFKIGTKIRLSEKFLKNQKRVGNDYFHLKTGVIVEIWNHPVKRYLGYKIKFLDEIHIFLPRHLEKISNSEDFILNVK